MGRGAAVEVGGGDTGRVFAAGAEALLETLVDEGDDIIEEEDEEERAVRRSPHLDFRGLLPPRDAPEV